MEELSGSSGLDFLSLSASGAQLIVLIFVFISQHLAMASRPPLLRLGYSVPARSVLLKVQHVTIQPPQKTSSRQAQVKHECVCMDTYVRACVSVQSQLN